MKRIWSITVAAVVLLTMICPLLSVSAADEPVSLQITVSEENVVVGDTLQVTVQLNNYANDWASIGVDLDYDSSVLEIADISDVQGASVFGGEPIIELDPTAEHPLRVVWLSANGENIQAESADFDLLQITFNAIGSSKEASIDVGFMEGGLAYYDETGKSQLVELSAYDNTIVQHPIIIEEAKPYLSIEASQSSVMQGEYVTVTVRLNDFNTPWAVLSLLATFDSEIFTIEDMETDVVSTGAFLGEFMAEYRIGKDAPLAVCWFNTEDAGMASASEEIMTFKLLALENVSINEENYPISVSFIPEGNVCMSVSKGPLSDEFYVERSNELEVEVKEVAENIPAQIKQSKMTFNYNFGNRNIDTYRQENGAGEVAAEQIRFKLGGLPEDAEMRGDIAQTADTILITTDSVEEELIEVWPEEPEDNLQLMVQFFDSPNEKTQTLAEKKEALLLSDSGLPDPLGAQSEVMPKQKSTVPNTGDGFDRTFWIFLMVFGGSALAVALLLRKREQE